MSSTSGSSTSGSLRVAVTGGSGRIGRAVIRELIARGHQVLNLDRRQSPDKLARFVYVDLCHREQVQPVLEQVDAVVHLAEMTNASLPYSADEIFSHNTRVSPVVMQTAADLGIKRLIYTSSCQAYGCWDRPSVPPLRLPFDETHPLQPQNVYALSKACNESYAQWVARHHGLSVAIFRLPWVMGEGIPATGVPEEWWHWLEHETGALDGLATYVHAQDVARAYALALENPRPGCEAYHLTAAEAMTPRPLRQRILEHHPDYPRLPDDWPDARSPLLLDKAREHFGWEPRFNAMDHYRAWRRAKGKA